jgi:hypothetical protein
MAKKNEYDYEVGYGKPPRHSQFQPGQSGNPAGRPPGRKNLATIARSALHEEITVVENGKSKRMTKAEAAIVQMVNGALKGDLRAVKETIALARYVDQLEEVETAPVESENDAVILANLKRRLQRMKHSDSAAEVAE